MAHELIPVRSMVGESHLTSMDANFSYPIYEQLRTQNLALGDLLAFHATAVNATVGENADRVLAHEVSGNYDAVPGVQPQLGRAIRPIDDIAGSERVVSSDGRNWLADPASRSVNILARTKPGVSDGAAQAALDTQFSTIVRVTLPIHAAPRQLLNPMSRVDTVERREKDRHGRR